MSLVFGADYYPEHWPEERWPKDAELMSRAGFNTVRLAEFAWSKIEPREDEYDFEWLDKAIGLLGGKGIRTILGTPTAAPPPWIVKEEGQQRGRGRTIALTIPTTLNTRSE